MTGVKNGELTDRLCEATLTAVIDNRPIALREPGNCDASMEIIWVGLATPRARRCRGSAS